MRCADCNKFVSNDEVMGTFVLKIELGNDALRTRRDIARALVHIANQLVRLDEPLEEDSGRIRDVNGNTVGEWEVLP